MLEDRSVPAVFEVNSLGDTVDADPSVTSLREAITAANTAAGDDSITFAPGLAGTINLTSALPDLSTNIAIWGPGADLLEVRRDTGFYYIFEVPVAARVVLYGLKISNGFSGIRNFGTLTVTNSTVSGNTGGSGGGVYNDGGTLTIASSTVSGNSGNSGGGVYNEGGTLLITNCTVSNNSGGGVHNDGGTLTIARSTIAGNFGGRVGVHNKEGTLLIADSTVSGNSGGVYNEGGTLTLNNSTLSHNDASDDGGGLYLASGSATLNNVTITDNVALALGGGVGGGGILVSGAATLTLHNTLVAGNGKGWLPFQGTFASRDDINGAVAAASSFNLIGSGAGLTGVSNGVNGNQIGTALAPIDPRLGPLANNGGPTLTHALLTGSPALDRGFAPGAPVADQRGVGRFGSPDIGSFELPPPVGAASVVNVTSMVAVTKTKLTLMATGRLRQKATLVNKSGQRIQGPISLVLDRLTADVKLWRPTGKIKGPFSRTSFYLNRLPGDGILDPGEKLTFVLEFVVPPSTTTVAYKVRVLAGNGPR